VRADARSGVDVVHVRGEEVPDVADLHDKHDNPGSC
jgi:hypothetical protein